MRPISVEFQAFGPYKGREYVNFEDLSRNGLFLICGETGSGKTMILDAISFALYGRSSGANRDDLTELRCNRCDPTSDTFVRFTFEEKGEVYIFERMLVFKRKNLSKSQNVYRLRDGIVEPVFDNCRDRDINSKAEEIIGLSYDQFRQVIILPQGKFEKLLTSESSEKEAILVNIFGAGKWKAIAESYFDRAKQRKDVLDEIKKSADRSLAEEGCSSLEDLESKIHALEDSAAQMEKEYEAANYSQNKALLNSKSLLAGEFATLHDYENKLKNLALKADDIAVSEKTLELAVKAEDLRKPLDALNSAEKETSARRNTLNASKSELEAAEASLVEAEKALKDHKTGEDEYKKTQKKKTEYEMKTEDYKSLSTLSVKEKEALQKLNEAKANVVDCNYLWDTALKKTEVSYKKLQEAAELSRLVRASYMAGICGVMAESLSSGEACPVCGSTEHPHKAVMPDGTKSRADVENAEKDEETCRKVWTKDDDSRKKAEEKLSSAKERTSVLTAEYESAKSVRMNAEKSLIPGISNLEELQTEITKFEQSIKEYEDKEKTLNSGVSEAEKRLSAAKNSSSTASAELQKAETAFNNATDEFASALAVSGFCSQEEARDAMLPDKQRKTLTAEIEAYKAGVLQLKGLYEEKLLTLKGKEEPDPEDISSQLKDIEAKETEYIREHTRNSEQHERLLGKYTELKKNIHSYLKDIASAEDDLLFAKALRGDTGIGLQRYVLGIMFSSVISAANEMLAKVQGGRYRLFRTDEKTGDAKKRGLDLKVYDSFGGGPQGRSVSTLSGGEKFLASLALSIGMSTVAKTGGVDIEGLFIDEGFGSLDSESIDDALEVLSSIRREKGMVGIISHVDVLRANIPTQLNVIKGRGTSTIQLS